MDAVQVKDPEPRVKKSKARRPVKRCPKCRTRKYVEEFSKNAKASDGLQSWCKLCMDRYNKRYAKGRTEKKHRRAPKKISTRKREAFYMLPGSLVQQLKTFVQQALVAGK